GGRLRAVVEPHSQGDRLYYGRQLEWCITAQPEDERNGELVHRSEPRGGARIGSRDAWVDARHTGCGACGARRAVVDYPAAELRTIQHQRSLPWLGNDFLCVTFHAWFVWLHGRRDGEGA